MNVAESIIASYQSNMAFILDRARQGARIEPLAKKLGVSTRRAYTAAKQAGITLVKGRPKTALGNLIFFYIKGIAKNHIHRNRELTHYNHS